MDQGGSRIEVGKALRVSAEGSMRRIGIEGRCQPCREIKM